MESPFLLITDDPALQPAIASALQSSEMQAVPCEPARSISMAASTAPSLILLDLEIRSVAWSSVLTALLMEPRTRGVPVIGLTRTPGKNHVLSIVAGMHDVLSLPFDAERLEQLSTLLLTLSFQFGSGDSEPGSAAADRLTLYAERSGLSGTLVRGPLLTPLGHATFSLGAVTSARFSVATGRSALAGMLAAKGDLAFESGTLDAPVRQGIPDVKPLDASALESIQPASAAPSAAERLRVLAIDDDLDLVEMVAAFLQKDGFDVDTASDGEEGFVAALAMRPEVIVSDLEMPRLDGWGLLRKIRADHRVADTPFLFLSAAEDFRMSIQAAAAGAQDYLSKGGARDLLSTRLRGALAPRRELESAIRAARPARSRVELVGSRWALLRFGALAARGSVILADGVGLYEVAFEDGQLRSADSTVGDKVLAGAQALEGFLAVRAGDLVITHATRRPANFTGPIAEVVEAAAVRNNVIESLAVTRALAAVSGVAVDRNLCDLYARFGPVSGRAVAAGLAAGKAPLDLLAVSMTPMETETVLRDLARRRVILVPSK